MPYRDDNHGRPRDGIIRPEEHADKMYLHKCKVPWLWFKPVGTLFRCHCGKVYCIMMESGGYEELISEHKAWCAVDLQVWVDAGGGR